MLDTTYWQIITDRFTISVVKEHYYSCTESYDT
jgi:hypothetical protein